MVSRLLVMNVGFAERICSCRRRIFPHPWPGHRHLLRNEAERARENNPLQLVVVWQELRNSTLVVTTSTEHLAHALEKARDFLGKSRAPATDVLRQELATVGPECTVLDEPIEHTGAAGQLQVEQACGLREGQTQARHLLIFGAYLCADGPIGLRVGHGGLRER